MKKQNLFAMIITAAMTISFATSTALTAFAGSASGVTGKYTEYVLNGLDPNAAETKPTLSLSRIELPINVALENPVQEVELTVTGARLKYAPTGLHIGYDERLTVVNDEFGFSAELGKAGRKLAKSQSPGHDNSIFVTTSCAYDYGLDGVLWTLRFRLPETIEVGDEFPIEILYRSENGTSDVFASALDDKESNLMEAWVFTNGIEQGFIRITEAIEVLPDEPAEKELMLGDVNADNQINSKDSSYILAAYSLIQTGQDIDLSPEQIKAADINGDGKIDAKDASDALRYYSYLSTGGTLDFMDFLEL